ncbi:MAG TPA: hypothetical protein VIY86_04715, partial [Pirellulaceae bacterium]
ARMMVVLLLGITWHAVPGTAQCVCEGPCQHCVDGQCRPNRETYGFFETQWRRWPIESPEYAAIQKARPVADPSKGPEVEVPEADDEATTNPEFPHLRKRARDPFSADPTKADRVAPPEAGQEGRDGNASLRSGVRGTWRTGMTPPELSQSLPRTVAVPSAFATGPPSRGRRPVYPWERTTTPAPSSGNPNPRLDTRLSRADVAGDATGSPARERRSWSSMLRLRPKSPQGDQVVAGSIHGIGNPGADCGISPSTADSDSIAPVVARIDSEVRPDVRPLPRVHPTNRLASARELIPGTQFVPYTDSIETARDRNPLRVRPAATRVAPQPVAPPPPPRVRHGNPLRG